MPDNPIILALDLSEPDHALEVVHRLKPHVGLFKVGLQLFSVAGPQIVRDLRQSGARVFLDLKLHDIPNTVARAVVEAGRLGVSMLTLHTLGGSDMMRHAKESASEAASKEGWELPRLLGVTILTSHSEGSLSELGISGTIPDSVLRLAELAAQSGMDGLVASPQELTLLTTGLAAPLLKVIPGIRPSGSTSDDQARTLTPAQAIAAGADYLVIGRPVLRAPNPESAVLQIRAEIGR